MLAWNHGSAQGTGRHQIQRDFKATLERTLPRDAGDAPRDQDPLAPPLDDEGWDVPGVIELDGEDLVWRWEGSRRVRSGPGMLEGFLALGEGPDVPPERVLAFARRWGVLMLCADHELPWRHNWPSLYDLARLAADGDLPPGSSCFHRRHPSGGEAVRWRAWLWYAHQMRTALGAAALVRGDRAVPGLVVYELSVLRLLRAAIDGEPVLTDPAFTRHVLTSHIEVQVRGWLKDGRVGLAFSWGAGDEPILRLAGDGLFGGLVAQLVVALRGTGGLAFCAGCLRGYAPERKPRLDQGHYCPACRPDPTGRRRGSVAKAAQTRTRRARRSQGTA